MHAFPATGGNVAVSHGGNGAGSIAIAGGEGREEASGGAGASRPRAQAALGSDDQRSLLQALNVEGEANARRLDAQEFPPLSSVKGKGSGRKAATLFISKRKGAASEAAMGPSEQRSSQGGRQLTDALELMERDGGASAQRAERGIAKQRRKMKKEKRVERRAARAARAEAQADAEGGEGNEELEGDDMETAEGAGGAVPVALLYEGIVEQRPHRMCTNCDATPRG